MSEKKNLELIDAKPEKKNFGLINAKGEQMGTFSGKQPRDAALKVANKGIADIVLRELGTKTLHYFKGSRVLVPCPASAPEWVKKAAAAKGGKINKAKVEKLGVGHLVKSELASEDNPAALFKLPAAKKSAAKKPAKK